MAEHRSERGLVGIYGRFLRKRMLGRFLVVATLVAAIPFTMLFSYVFISLRSETTREAMNKAEGSIGALVESGNRMLLQYAQKSQFIATNRVLGERLGKDFSDDLQDKVLFYSEVNQMIANTEFYENPSRSRYTIFFTNPSLYESRYFRSMDHLAGGPSILERVAALPVAQVYWLETTLKDPSGQECIALYRSIPTSGSEIGLLEVLVPVTELEVSLDAVILPNGSKVEYMDGRRRVFGRFSTNSSGFVTESETDAELDTGPSVLVQGSFLNAFAVNFQIPRSTLSKSVDQYLGVMITLFLLTLLFIAGVSFLTTKRVVGRLETFVDSLDQGEALHLLPSEPDSGPEDEVTTIQRKFTDLIRKNEGLHRENMDAVRNRINLETSLLQMKLNPHLLYNSLSVLRWKALAKEDAETVTLVDRMARYYRAVLSKGSDIVQVSAEIGLVEDYIWICETTQAAPILLEVDVEESVAGLSIFKLLLQPLVENAILHGLGGETEDRRIRIVGRREADRLILSVEDNGVGIPQGKLDQILSGQNVKRMGGFGINNLRERLKVYYREDHGFSIESEPGRYTRVTLWIPIIDPANLSERYILDEGETSCAKP